MGSVQQVRRDVASGDFEVALPGSQTSVWSQRTLRCSSVYVSAGKMPDMPAWPLRARSKLFLGSNIPVQEGSISQSMPQWSRLLSLAFYPGRSQRAAVSAKGPVLSVHLDEKQKGGDGMSRSEPAVRLCVSFRLLG